MTQNNLTGQTLGEYNLEQILGKGSVATVYKATNANGEPVAFKLLTPKYGTSSRAVQVRFEREAETMARLDHPNIVRVLDSGHINGNAFMAMAYVKGKTLETLFSRRNGFQPLVTTEIGWQVAAALNYAWKEGVVHRDVKPSNILVTKDGHVFLTDFGIARITDGPQITSTGTIVGTAAYIAPEQVLHNVKPNGQSDLYSLGVTLYRMATGRLPFLGTGAQMMQAHAYEDPPDFKKLDRVPSDLQTIITTAMAKDPADRYPDGHTMAQALLELNGKLREQQNVLQRWWTRANFKFS